MTMTKVIFTATVEIEENDIENFSVWVGAGEDNLIEAELLLQAYDFTEDEDWENE